MSDERVIAEFQGSWRFLSNFHPASVVYGGWAMPTAEHAYQAAKTRPDDFEGKRLISECATPAEAKRAGQGLVLRDGWEDVKAKVMLGVLCDKFFRHPELGRHLAATYPARLVEGNVWHDNFWGDCTCGKKLQCSSPGRNVLGLLLEGVRTACLDYTP